MGKICCFYTQALSSTVLQWGHANQFFNFFLTPNPAENGNFCQGGGQKRAKKSVSMAPLQYCWRQSLGVKTTYFTHKVSYLNPEEEGSRCTKKWISCQNHFRIQMGLARLIFELHPSNFQNQHNVQSCKGLCLLT